MTDEEFLREMLGREFATLGEVTRLKRLADWAECDAPPTWRGEVNREEVRRAVQDARDRIRKTGK